jgi:hypothetical protein
VLCSRQRQSRPFPPSRIPTPAAGSTDHHPTTSNSKLSNSIEVEFPYPIMEHGKFSYDQILILLLEIEIVIEH